MAASTATTSASAGGLTSPRQLLNLSVVGFGLLWVVMLFNGMLSQVFEIQESGKFPDGRPLPASITGYPAVDSQLKILVTFLDPLMNQEKENASSRWLLLCLSNTLGAINSWVLIESRRRGVRNLWLRHTVMFITAWNSFGAAWVTPIYLFMIAKSKHTWRDRTIPLNEARGFPAAVVANALFGLLLLFPERFGLTPGAAVAIWSAGTPWLMVVVVVLASRPGTTLTTIETPKNAQRPHEDSPWTFAAFCTTGVISSLVHLFVLSGSPASVTTTRLFLPAPQKVYQAMSGSYTALMEGSHLFTQFDYDVLVIVCVVFTHYMLQNVPNRQGTALVAWNASQPKQGKLEFLYIALATAIIGPGGACSFALAVREMRLRSGP